MVHRLFGTQPLDKPVLAKFELDSREQVCYQYTTIVIHEKPIWKCSLQIDDDSISVSMCYTGSNPFTPEMSVC